MKDKSYEHQTFSGESFENEVLEGNHFYSCTFDRVSFQFATLKVNHFESCTFKYCNCSMLKLVGTRFSNAKFEDCKLMGVGWGGVNKFFSAAYKGCLLSNSSFVDLKLNKFVFKDCDFTEAMFSQTSLRQAVFDGCDLAGCMFDFCDLTEADFRSARNYLINARDNTIDKARFSLPEAVSLLRNFNIVLE